MILLDFATDKVQNAFSMLLPSGEKGKRSDAFSRILQELSLSLRNGEGNAGNAPILLQTRDGTGTNPVTDVATESPAAENAATGKTAPGNPENTKNTLGGLSAQEQAEVAMLHPNIRHRLDADRLRNVIANAKSYLQEQIRQVEAPKEMPATLKGLLELAQKIGIDIDRITLEQLQTTPPEQADASPQKLQPRQPLLLSSNGEKAPTAPKPLTSAELVETKTAKAPLPEKAASESGPLRSLLREEQATERKTEQGTAAPSTPSRQLPAAGTEQTTVQTTLETEVAQTTPKPAAAETPKTFQTAVATAKPETGTAASLKSSKADTAPQPADIRVPSGPELPKAAGETQRQRDAKQPQNTPLQARAVNDGEAPAQHPLFDGGLGQLLRGSSEEANTDETESGDQTAIKSSGEIAASKSGEKLEVKIGEAKQMVRHLAAEVREAVQNYKPPFTRVKVQLNPVKLGEVDVTVVQRGNNLHISISSNATAVTTLAQNASELRTQLAQNGMGNATMHFSSNADAQQQQQRQQRAKIYEAYETGDSFEALEQLEIIIPHYV